MIAQFAFVILLFVVRTSAFQFTRGELVCNGGKIIEREGAVDPVWVSLYYVENNADYNELSFNLPKDLSETRSGDSGQNKCLRKDPGKRGSNAIFKNKEKGRGCTYYCKYHKIRESEFGPLRQQVIGSCTTSKRGSYYSANECYCLTTGVFPADDVIKTNYILDKKGHFELERTVVDERCPEDGKQLYMVGNEGNLVDLQGTAGTQNKPKLVLVKVTNAYCDGEHTGSTQMDFAQHPQTSLTKVVSSKFILTVTVKLHRLIVVGEITVMKPGDERVSKPQRLGVQRVVVQVGSPSSHQSCEDVKDLYKGEVSDDEKMISFYVYCKTRTVADQFKIVITDSLTSTLLDGVTKDYRVQIAEDMDVAYGKPCKKASEVKEPVDGDRRTATSLTYQQSIQIDLKEIVTIYTIVILTKETTSKLNIQEDDIKIFTNIRDTKTWTRNFYGGPIYNGRLKRWCEVGEDGGCVARYVKIENGKRNPRNTLEIGEVKVFEANTMWFAPPMNCNDALTPGRGCTNLKFELTTGIVTKTAQSATASVIDGVYHIISKTLGGRLFSKDNEPKCENGPGVRAVVDAPAYTDAERRNSGYEEKRTYWKIEKVSGSAVYITNTLGNNRLYYQYYKNNARAEHPYKNVKEHLGCLREGFREGFPYGTRNKWKLTKLSDGYFTIQNDNTQAKKRQNLYAVYSYHHTAIVDPDDPVGKGDSEHWAIVKAY